VLQAYNELSLNDFLEEQELRHLNIKESFKNLYTFSDFAFFYSHDHLAIKAGDYSKVYDHEHMLKDIIVENKNVYILDSRNIRFESMGADQLGYAVKDHNFNQLKKPFPYYVRKREALFFLRRDYADMTRILNKNLIEFDKK